MDRDLPRGTVTILFTDVVGSTAMTTARGDEPAHEILRRQRELVRREIEQHAGHEVKTMGDGFMVVFSSARQAVNCAVAIQQALERQARERPADSVALRVGLNTGEAIADEEDFFGAAVTAAERVMGKASGGEIFVSESVRAVLGQASDVRLADRGRFRLKGFPDRVRLYEVIWREAAAPAYQDLSRTPFISRARELGVLRGALESAASGHGSMVLIAGEPGVGKTRLAEQIVEDAGRRGFLSFTGHCYEDAGAGPYGPIVEILDAVARTVPPSAMRDAFGDSLADVARVVPAIRNIFPDVSPVEHSADIARRQIFTGVRDFLVRSARGRPLILIIDDLHWADDATLRLVRQLARAVHEMPMLVVTTFRDGPQDVDSPLAQALDEWHRNHLVARIGLQPFSADEVRSLLGTLNGQPVPEGFARALHAETGGNAFFLEELVHHLAEEQPLFDDRGAWRADLRIASLPPGVRVVVDRRLRRLGKEAGDVLAAAAVLGQTFDAEIVERVAGISYDTLLDTIDRVERAGILVPEGEHGTSWRFAHSLTRTVLLDSLASGQKQRLHLAAADALAKVYGPAADRSADLARHCLGAGRLADPARTADALRMAGERAADSYAHREAARYFEKAVEIDRGAGVLAAGDRAGLLHAYGRTLYGLGRLVESREFLDQAGAEYERLGESHSNAEVLFSRAVLATYAARAADAVELLESAKPLAAGDGQLMARILQLEAQNLVQLRMYPRASQVVEDALLSAEQTGDRFLAAQARHAAGYLALSTLDMPLASKEFAFVVSAPGDLHQQMAAESRLAIALSCVGRLDEAALRSAAAVSYFRRMVDDGGTRPDESDPYESGIASLAASLPAIARGEYDIALAALAEALVAAGNPPNEGVVRMLLPLIVQIHHAAGRFDEADECIAHYLLRGEESARTPVFARIYDVLSSVARGRESRAAALPAPPPRMPDLQSLPVSVLAAETAVATRDAVAAARQIDAIRHLHETGMVFTTGWVALVPRLLGALRLLCGDMPQAQRCLDLAMSTAEAVGARPEMALTHLEIASLDVARGSDRFAAARGHVAEARRLLTGCRIRAHDRRLAELSAVVGASSALPDGLTDEDAAFLRMIAAGLSNQRIALDSALTVNAVQRRLGQLYRKIGVGDRRGATAYAYRNGIARDGA